MKLSLYRIFRYQFLFSRNKPVVFFLSGIKFLVKYVLIFEDILDHIGSKLDPLEMQYYVSERKKRKKNEYHRWYRRIFRYFEQYSGTRSNEVKSVEVGIEMDEDAIFYEYWKVLTENTTRFLMFHEFIESSTMSFAICLCADLIDPFYRLQRPNFYFRLPKNP